MNRHTMRDAAAAVAAGAGILLLADLSTGWYTVRVAVAGVIDLEADASGWGGLGTVAGLLTLAMLVSMIRPLRHDGAVTLAQAVATGVLGLGAFGFAVARALTGTASVTTVETAVHVNSTLWPAYCGIALAALMAAGVIAALALVLQGVRASSPLMHPAA